MTNESHGAAPLARASKVPGQAKVKVGLMATAGVTDLLLGLCGAPGFASALVSTGLGYYDLNTADAEKALRAEVVRQQGMANDLAARVQNSEIDLEELRSRVTSVMRVIHEAGRHPEQELRRALGTFAARVLIEDMDSIMTLELAEALSRMTSADLLVLRLDDRMEHLHHIHGEHSGRETVSEAVEFAQKAGYKFVDVKIVSRCRKRLFVLGLRVYQQVERVGSPSDLATLLLDKIGRIHAGCGPENTTEVCELKIYR